MTEHETEGTPVPSVSAFLDKAADSEADSEAPAQPASPLYDALEAAVLGGGTRLTSEQVVAATGVDQDRLTNLWRALGFPSPQPDEAIFVDADIKAIGQLSALLGSGILGADDEGAMVRTLGRTFARLTDWEIGQLAPQLAALRDVPAEDGTRIDIEEALVDLIGGFLPMVQQLQDYVWRRHLVSAAARALGAGGAPGVDLAVGFADIVNFTRTSRKLTSAELGELVETFEATVSEIINSQGGRVIKTIGDEVLFACDSPTAAAQIAIDLALRHGIDENFPEVRVGLAYGPVLARLGDVFGEVVNIASRLTSLARPGTVLINAELAALLADDFRVRRVPAERVRGYSRLQPWALRPALTPGDGDSV
jgi:adenylate cyclase